MENYFDNSIRARSATNPAMGHFLISFISLYILLSPYYFFASGEPQLCDFVAALGGVFLLVDIAARKTFFLKKGSSLFCLLLVVLSLWSLLVNLSWGVFLADSLKFIKNSQYIIFNSLVAFIVIYVHDNYIVPVKKILLYSFLVSLVMLFILQPFFLSDFSRARLSFNNPNQLAYFSLISFIAMTCIREREFNLIFRFIGFAISLWFLLISVSLSALLSTIPIFLLLCFIFLIRFQKNPVLITISILIALLLSLSIYTFYDVGSYFSSMINSPTGEIVQNRAARVGELVEGASEQRGYYRFFEYPEVLILGSGQGFDYRYGGMEIHSTLFSSWFYYGVPGLLVIFLVFAFPLYRLNIHNFAATASYSLYGITHLGWRFTLIWILIALLILEGPVEHDSEK